MARIEPFSVPMFGAFVIVHESVSLENQLYFFGQYHKRLFGFHVSSSIDVVLYTSCPCKAHIVCFAMAKTSVSKDVLFRTTLFLHSYPAQYKLQICRCIHYLHITGIFSFQIGFF